MVKSKPNELSLDFTTELFFDTNIWIFLFGIVGDFKQTVQKEYSSLFDNVLSRNNTIYITSMVLSEYANVILRIEFKNWQKQQGRNDLKYKQDFVGTTIYQEKVELVKKQIEKILKLRNIIKLPDDFNAIRIDKVFEKFGPADFNDAYINEIVRVKGCVLVTDDGDFEAIFSGKTLVTLR
jgi:predicted nucleic acid-binding protein